MSSTPTVGARLDPDMLHRAAERHGLDGYTPSAIVRYALALAAGESDPAEVVRAVRRGPKPGNAYRGGGRPREAFTT